MITNVSKLVSSYGRSDRIRTCGILLPKQARYHLRYTSIVKGKGRDLVYYKLPPAEKSSFFYSAAGEQRF